MEAGEAKPATTSELLLSLAAGEAEAMPLGRIVEAAGSRVHGLGLFIFVLPEVVPLPLPSLSTALGLPLAAISAHLALFGEGSALPKRLEAITIPRKALTMAARYLAPLLARLEHASLARWEPLARRERPIGLVCLYLSLILLLPIPLMNFLPALCLAVIALGMIQRDGLLIAAGLLGTVAMTALLVGLIDIVRSAFLD